MGGSKRKAAELDQESAPCSNSTKRQGHKKKRKGKKSLRLSSPEISSQNPTEVVIEKKMGNLMSLDAPASDTLTDKKPETGNEDEWKPAKSKKKAKKKDKKAAKNSQTAVPKTGLKVSPQEVANKPVLSWQWSVEKGLKTLGMSSLPAKAVQELLLSATSNQLHTRLPWVTIENRALIKKVVLVNVDGLTSAMFSRNATSLPWMKKLFTSPAPLYFQGSRRSVVSGLQTLLWAGISQKMKKEKMDSRKETSVVNTALLCTKKQLAECGFPAFPPGWWGEVQPGSALDMTAYVKTKAHVAMDERDQQDTGMPVDELEEGETSDNSEQIAPPTGDNWPMFGLDCEMCRTEEGLELCRVSLIDGEGTLLVNELVKPDRPIHDYLTKFSGITEELLRTVSTTLKDVQQTLVELLPIDAVLVGHSLDNDMKALKMVHPYIIDTSLLYPHTNGPLLRNSLKHLTKTYLGRVIQDQEGGHDSTEDALAALDLVKLKMKKGLWFGDPSMFQESIFQRLAGRGKKGALVGPPDIMQNHVAANSVPCLDDKESINKTLPLLRNPNIDLVFTHLCNVASVTDPDQLSSCLGKLDDGVHRIYEALPDNALLLVVAGPGNIPDCNNGAGQQGGEETPLHAQLIEEARRGLMFAVLKGVEPAAEQTQT